MSAFIVSPRLARKILARVAELREETRAVIAHIRELENLLSDDGLLGQLSGELFAARELLEHAADGYLSPCPPEIYYGPEYEDGSGSACSITTLQRIADGQPLAPPERLPGTPQRLRLIFSR
jgi:hypothetical protein